MRRHRSRAHIALMIALVGWPAAGGAIGGVTEINQASVVDAGGFPLSIASGSYVLTSDLAAPADTTAIVVTGDDVTIDLNGFTVDGGTGGCTLTPPSIFCPGGSGHGIDATGRVRVRVQDGSVRHFAGDCLRLGTHAVVERVSATGCSGDGVSVSAVGAVRETIAALNGGAGIRGTAELQAVTNVSYGNAGNGIRGTRNAHVRDSVADTNGGIGVSTGVQGLVEGNVVVANQQAGIEVGNRSRVAFNVVTHTDLGPGVSAQDDASVRGNAVFANGLSNVAHGITCGFRCDVADNASGANTNDGINVGGGGVVQCNNTRANGADGIHCAALGANSCAVVGNFSNDNVAGYGLRIAPAAAVVGTYKKNGFHRNGAGSVNQAGLDPGLMNTCAGTVPCP